MSDVALRRWSNLLAIADQVPSRQRPSLGKALDEAVCAAVAEARSLDDPGERVLRLYDILTREIRFVPPSEIPPRRPIGEFSDDETASLYMESLFVEDERERRAILRSAGMPRALANRLRDLAAEGRL